MTMWVPSQRLLVLWAVVACAALPVAASSRDLDVSGELRFTSNDGYVSVGSGALGIRAEDQIVLAFDTNGDTSSTDGLYIRDGATNLMFVREDGNVGIGTLTPGQRLDVAGNIRLSTEEAFVEGTAGNLRLHSEDSLVLKLDANNDASLTEGFYFRRGDNSTLVTIMGTGRMGLGTGTPEEQLHVVGNVKVTGNIAAKYQDVAEWVEAASPLEPGTVVVIRKAVMDGVESSRRAYDSSVAGVVSAQPGVVLGEPGPGKVLVAQSGRVRVKVDAGTSGIEPGDLLVTSAVTGYAMKSVPIAVAGTTFHRPGTLLGKALQPLSRGRGEILVLLTLQ